MPVSDRMREYSGLTAVCLVRCTRGATPSTITKPPADLQPTPSAVEVALFKNSVASQIPCQPAITPLSLVGPSGLVVPHGAASAISNACQPRFFFDSGLGAHIPLHRRYCPSALAATAAAAWSSSASSSSSTLTTCPMLILSSRILLRKLPRVMPKILAAWD